MILFRKGRSDAESPRYRNYRKWSGLISFFLLLFSAFMVLGLMTLSDWINYSNALSQYNKGNYAEALKSFEQLKDYKDSQYYYELSNKSIMYLEGLAELENDPHKAWEIFLQLGDFSISDTSCKSSDLAKQAEYAYAQQLFEDGKLEEALPYFQELDDYQKSKLYVSKIISESEDEYQKSLKYANAYIAYQEKRYDEALVAFLDLGDYKDSAKLAQECEEYLQKMEKSASTISAGIQGSLALTTNHSIISVGEGTQNFDFSDWENIVSISAFGLVAVGLKYDGEVLMIPEIRHAEEMNDWTEIVAIATGHNYVIGLKNDGSLVRAGHNGDGQTNVTSWKNITAIATAWRRTVGLAEDGTIYITGYGSSNQLKEIERAKANEETAWTDIVAIATGGGHYTVGHTVGLKANGHVVTVGDNSWGQRQVEHWENIVAIAAGDKHTVGLTTDGKVLVAGDPATTAVDENGAIIGWDHIVKIAAGTGYTLGLREDGTVLAVGFDAQGQIPEPQEWTGILVYNAWKEK